MSLADAILFKPIEIIQHHLDQTKAINEIDEYGFTPLIEAIIAERLEVGELLIQQGADIHEPDLTYCTPLHWAVENNHLGFVKLLLDHKADPNAYNSAHQPVLVKALLRDQHLIKKLLYQYGADLNFAQDYINTKLLGHRFELKEIVDIVDAKGKFIELEFAGFFLEFTLGIIYYSLRQFLNNFAAREYRPYFQYFKPVLDALANANQIIHYQQYLLNFEKYDHQIKLSLSREPLIIPACYDGHAICFVKQGDWLAKCDRGVNSKEEGAVVIYQIQKEHAFTTELVKNLIFRRQSKTIIHHQLNDYLGLEKIGDLPVRAQVIGNCAWANVEATIPTLFFMNLLQDIRFKESEDALKIALGFYDAWQTWDKDIALNECIQSFWLANPARKASRAALLAAILFQTCKQDDPVNQSRARRLLQVLSLPEYRYILKGYLKVYQKKYSTAEGRRLLHWLRESDIHAPDYLE